MLLNAFKYIDLKNFRTLYCAMIRPILEYGNVIWYPTKQKDIDAIERIQRKITKRAPGLNNLPYEDRLKALDLPTLEERRIRGDLIHIFKIIKGFDFINWRETLKFKYLTRDKKAPRTRGHHLQYIKKGFKEN